MKRSDLLPYVAFLVDDACSITERPAVIPEHARLVYWQCGFEPMVVAVASYLPGVTIDDEEAECLAIDVLAERRWFADLSDCSATGVI